MRILITAGLTMACATVGVAAACAPAAPAPGTGRPSEREIASIVWVGCDTVARNTAVPGVTTPVEICAADYARKVGPRNAGPDGRPVARMRNLGTVNEGRWNLRPGRRYIIAVYSGVAGGTYRITHEGPGGPLGSGVYHPCGPAHEPPTSSATFGACRDYGTGPAPNSSIGSGPSAGEPATRGHALLGPADGPAWISCTDGCCTTDIQ